MTTWDAGNQLLETLESAAAKGHHEQVLEESTTACNHLVQLYMGFLDLRAKTRAIRGQFDTALDDAATMQQLAPASAMGYLRGGYIYDMRGLRREAIRVYDQGLNNVSTDDPAYQRLVDAKSSSEEALNHRFDFMEQLSPDILMNIVPRFVGNDALPSDKEYPYLNVSKRWHHLIPPIAGFHFIINQPQTLDQGHDHLVSVSRHVKTLTLQSCPKTINRLFQRASFEALTQLTIKDCTLANEDSFLLLLRAVGRNLTHLTISKLALEDSSSISLRWILLDCSCPNLKSLYISDVNIVINSLHLYPKLEKLSIRNSKQSFGKEAALELLSSFPSLKSLVVDKSVDSSVLTVAKEKCPSLYKLWFGWVRAPTNTYSGDGGIYDLMLDLDRRNGANYADTVGLLVKHCQTLMGCRLHLGAVGQNPGVCDVDLPDIKFKRLKTLHIVSFEEGSCQQRDTRLFEWIIQQSPDIENFYLDGVPAIRPQVTKLLYKFTSLRRAMFRVTGDGQIEPILQLLLHHQSLGTGSILHQVILYFDHFTNNSHMLLSALTRLPKLKGLRIEVSWNSLFSGVNMPNFVKALAIGCPNLESMDLIFYQGIQQGVVSRIPLMRSLKTLTLATKELSVEDAAALAKCNGCEKVTLYGCTYAPGAAALLPTTSPTIIHNKVTFSPSYIV